MTEPPPPLPTTPPTRAALRQHRERTIALLSEHFVRDNLEAEDLENLLDRAHRAGTPAELDALVQGLPALAAPPVRGPGNALDRPDEARDRQFVVAVMGGAERVGVWSPARQLYAVAVMGGIDLDFREAVLPPGVTEIYVLAIMGGVEIVVPPGVEVQSNGMGIMGGFDHRGRGRAPVNPGAPVLRISGLALMGGVEVSERLPGEPEGDARRRRRAERRNARRLERP